MKPTLNENKNSKTCIAGENPMTNIDTALAARNMMPINPVCPCCKDTLGRDDFPALSAYPATGPAAIAAFGSIPCHGCIEDMHTCAGCGQIVSDNGMDGTGDFDGERFCNEGCEYDAIEALEGDDHSTHTSSSNTY